MDYAALSPEDLVRTCLVAGDESAWAEFIRRFQPLIAGVVLRVCRKCGEVSPQTVDDLIQETYLKLCSDRARLRTFESAHPDAIYGYLKVFTANLVHDHFKAVSSQKRGRNVTSTLRDDLITQESRRHSEVEMIERSILISQIDTALSAPETGTNSQRDRRIFWLHYRAGLSASAIATLPTIWLTTKGVESTLLRLVRQVRERLVDAKRQAPPTGIRGEGVPSAESF